MFSETSFHIQRQKLIEQLAKGVDVPQAIQDQSALRHLAQIPRHQFIDPALARRAYDNAALPIGHGQTISQPYIVARKLELAFQNAPALQNVLEIGTGCGYQAAVLSLAFAQVFSIERIGALAKQARTRLEQLGYKNIQTRHGDGMAGWAECAPFDVILLAAAGDAPPFTLLKQLKEGGILLAPMQIGNNKRNQGLFQFKRYGEQFEKKLLESAHFVPLLAGLS